MFIPIIVAFLLSLVFTRIAIVFARRHNLFDDTNPRKMHTGNIPRFGGIGLFASFIVVFSIYSLVFHHGNFVNIAPLMIGGLIIFVEGMLDDVFGLRAKVKFLLQIFASLAVAMGSVYYNSFFFITFPAWFGRLLTFFLILLEVNAFNLIDGLDWLCGGISFLSTIAIGIMMIFMHDPNMEICFILAACIFGFLFWNKPNAKIFLGDAGSQTLGFAVSVLPLLCSKNNATFEYNKLLLVILLTSIPTTDVIAAIWRRLREHRSVFSADRGHIHHKLVNIGFSKLKAIAFLLGLQFLVCVSIIPSAVMGRRQTSLLFVVMYCFIVIIFSTLHYINRAVNLKFKGCLSEEPQPED